jgi:metallo-beta-lactamase family protein
MWEDQATKILKTIDDLSWGFEYSQPFDLKRGIRFMLGRAGHILGSCFIHFEWEDPSYSIVFSGDLGAHNTPLLPDPDAAPSCDLLVLESTYGDRCHEDRTERIRRLGGALNRAFSDGGKVFIPAFALGRVQEMIYEMDRLFSNPEFACCIPKSEIQNPKSKVPVFFDSPLGLQITEITSRLSQYWDKEAREIFNRGDHPLDFDHLYAVKSYEDHLKLLEISGPAIIVAGSGMCTGGRIMDHLTAGLEDPRNDIFFVGYQVKGTPGGDIIRYGGKPGGYVYLDGERVTIKAKVHTLTGYSAHADRTELIEWVQSMPEKPGRIKLVHGDFAARKALADRLWGLGYPNADFR